MGDFVDKSEVERIREHYHTYEGDKPSSDGDNRAAPVSGVYDASTFREVSTWYINRLLRYIEVQEWTHDLDKDRKGT